MITVVHLAILTSVLASLEAVKVHFVHWNSSNPLFFGGRGRIHIDSGGTRHQNNYEQAELICPIYSESVPRYLTETLVVYNVTRLEYEKCQILSENAKIVALCNTPFRPKFFTLTFRSFSPTPGAFEFHPGQNYYFITTSSRKSRSCSAPHMRLVIHIEEEEEDQRGGEQIRSNQKEFVSKPREMPSILLPSSGSSRIKLSSKNMSNASIFASLWLALSFRLTI